jgi:hypothetical protein
LANFDGNPVVQNELNAARDSPVGSAANTYTNMWSFDDAFPDDWTKGYMNMETLYTSMVDLFARLSV